MHNQIAGLFYWPKVNVQIRIKANIIKTSSDISDLHFMNRSKDKNALAISSQQSKKVISYKKVEEDYNKVFKELNICKSRPDYWGGYSFTPFYFEFWQGNKSRLNKREVFEMIGGEWRTSILQP